MSISRQIQEKIYRLETLRKYQAYYGPNTPYQVVAEINQLEVELRQMLQADVTRRTERINQPDPIAKPPQMATPVLPKKQKIAPIKKKTGAKKKAQNSGMFGLSQATADLIATISFIGFMFLLGAIIFAAYVQSQSDEENQAFAMNAEITPLLRPTFTSTPDPNNPQGETEEGIDNGLLPPAVKQATNVATFVPSLTPSDPTPTATPFPTDTPVPTNTPRPLPPPPTATPLPPTNTPAPEFPFEVFEQGNRFFQKTSYHVINIYVAITTQDNVPIGDLRIIGDHTPSSQHVESAPSDWHWSISNCLDCAYIKFGNVKFEPGTFTDGVWNIYVADLAGNRLSPVVPFSYSTEPDQWVWDFVLFKKLPGF